MKFLVTSKYLNYLESYFHIRALQSSLTTDKEMVHGCTQKTSGRVEGWVN